MSDEELEPRELLLKTQRKEKKDLQAKIQALKKAASKGDKKKKKDVAEEIASLEAEMNLKHKNELAALDAGSELVSENGEIKVEHDNEKEEDEGEDKPGEQRISKAQKRRDKKAAKEKERQREIEAQEEENRYGARNREAEQIKTILNSRNLVIKEVPSNGDCLFAGIVHHLHLGGVQTSVKEMRKAATDEIKSSPDDYLPYLSNSAGDMLNQAEFEKYCQDMLETPAWGGQVELRALSKALKRPIEVIQANGPQMVIGEEFIGENGASGENGGSALLLTYHRHAYGLGEHYNAAVKRS